MLRKPRKTKLDADMLQKLCVCFEQGKFVRQCAHEAGITQRTLYKYLKTGRESPLGSPFRELHDAYQTQKRFLINAAVFDEDAKAKDLITEDYKDSSPETEHKQSIDKIETYIVAEIKYLRNKPLADYTQTDIEKMKHLMDFVAL